MESNLDYFGWLWKRGSSRFSSWRRRYFEITDVTLSYYTDEDKKNKKGKIHLAGIRSALLPSSPRRKKNQTDGSIPYALYIYTRDRTYQFEYGGEDDSAARGYLEQWFSNVLKK